MLCVLANFLQGLGLEYCRDLARRGCRLLVITSRSGALPEDVAREFAAAGVAVHVVKADAGDAGDMARVLSWVRENLPPIRHYAHAAGVSGFDLLRDLTPAAFWAVADAKVVGAAAVTPAALPVHSQLLLSSTSAVWSQTGAAHYAAANAALDALAGRRQGAGLPATSLQLGPFAGAGMAAGHIDALAALGLKGLQPSQLAEGFAAAGTAPQMVYARIEAPRFAQLYTAKGRWSLLDSMLTTSSSAAASAGIEERSSGDAVTADRGVAPPAAAAPRKALVQLHSVEAVVRKTAADILGEAMDGEHCLNVYVHVCIFASNLAHAAIFRLLLVPSSVHHHLAVLLQVWTPSLPGALTRSRLWSCPAA